MNPPYLQKGDTVGIIAPARKITREDLQPAIDIIQSWGLKIQFSDHLFGSSDQYSGTDEERASDLQKMLDDVSVKAVISARGGYGALRIIDRINFDGFIKFPKWIIGYSDITVLHSHIQQYNIETLHAAMPVDFARDEESCVSVYNALFGKQIRYDWQPHHLNRSGITEGIITGGNLSLLYAINNSKSDIHTSGKILFLEDLDEYLYHIDRMMLNLKRSGKLENLAGLVVGGMTKMKDNKIPFGKNAEEIISDAVKEYSYPVCFDFPAGHIKRNLAIFLGRKVKLIVNEKSEITF